MASSPPQDELFPTPPARPAAAPTGRAVRVVCDVASIEREFDYVVPDRLVERAAADGLTLAVGTMVRVPLHGRQVAAWITDLDTEPPAGVELRAVTRISGVGPPADVVALCRWAAWRWAGRLPTFLGSASPPSMVARPSPAVAPPATAVGDRVGERVTELVRREVGLIRLPPAASPLEVVRALAARGPVLVVAPTAAGARTLADGMRRAGITTAVHPDGWARGAAGSSVVGTRTAVFAPVAGLAGIVVVDEHDETLQNEGSPTWHAREVAVERARRAGVPVVLVSPVPSLEALALVGGDVVTIDRARERRGWATVRVVDRRSEDLGRTGLFSEALARVLQSERRVVCVLNRTGRAGLLGCRSCGTLAACERCAAAVRQPDDGAFHCPRCATARPAVCAECGSTAFRTVRLGVSKAREQLEALVREPVDEITGASRRPAGRPARRVAIGTEAALRRVDRADVVAFLEFDQELGAPRYRAAEQALAMLAAASRIVGGRDGEVLVQTMQPDHEVLRAAVLGDPSPVTAAERERRSALGLPPFGTLVVVGGEAAPAYVMAAMPALAAVPGTVVDQRDERSWLIRAADRDATLDVLGSVTRPPGRLRLQVDPARLPTP